MGVGVSGECAGPGDVAVTGGIEGVAAFGEGPASAGVEFAEGEVVGGDVLLGAWEAFFGDRELVHEGETKVLFLSGEIDFEKTAAELAGSFPTDLTTETGFVTSTTDGGQMLHEKKEDGFDEVPVFGPNSEECAEPKFGTFGFVDIESREIPFTGGGDVETEAGIFDFGFLILD